MIQFLVDGIDQLDLALDQLAVRDRNFDRFALMLVDNIVELTLHRFAQDRAGENDLWTTLKKPKLGSKPIEAALGQNFDSKVKLAAKLNLISDAACGSVLNLHAFRNTAYHRGLRHEGILHSLSVFYLTVTCELLKAYKPRFWSWGSSDVVSHRARKYLGDLDRTEPAKRFHAAFQRLGEVAASMKPTLAADLGADMEKTVDETDTVIQFLSTDSPKPMSRDRTLIYAQAWALAPTDQGEAFARDHGCAAKTVQGYVDWLSVEYAWPAKRDPIPSWRSRLTALRRETDPHRALKRYCDFMKQTDGLRATLNEAGAALDGYIQDQIDRARGK